MMNRVGHKLFKQSYLLFFIFPASSYDCDVVCQNGATCDRTCKAFTCTCTFNWNGQNCNEACTNALTLRNSTDVILGNSLTITCSAHAKSSTVFWSRSLTEFNMSSISRLTNSGTLTIGPVLNRDSGLYYCYVDDGTCVSRQQVTVNVVWDFPPTAGATQILTTKEGDSLELFCNVSTRPPALFFWQFSTETISIVSPTQSASCLPSIINATNETVPCVTPAATNLQLTMRTNKSKTQSRLFIKSLVSADKGIYICVAEYPGEMTFILSTFNLVVGPATSPSSLKPGNTSAVEGQKKTLHKLDLWIIAIIVYGGMLFGVIFIVAVFVIRMKYNNKEDIQVAPACDDGDDDNDEPSFTGRRDSQINDFCDGDDLYGCYTQEDSPIKDKWSAPAENNFAKSPFANQLGHEVKQTHMEPPFNLYSEAQRSYDGRMTTQNFLPPLDNLSGNGNTGGNMHALYNAIRPPVLGNQDDETGAERKRRRKIIRE